MASQLKLAMGEVRRILVIVIPIVSLYIVTGTLMYGFWWYGFVWDLGWSQGEYWRDALVFFQSYPYLCATIMVVGIAAIILLNLYWLKLAPIIDRLGFALSTASVGAILIVSFLNGAWYRDSIQPHLIQPHLRFLKTPRIVEPIDFHFLDAPRVTALYNQIEPELIKTKRITSSMNRTEFGTEMDVGPARGSGKFEEESGTSTEAERVDFTPERKCVELMKKGLKDKLVKWFSTPSDWYHNTMDESYNESVRMRERLMELRLELAFSEKERREILLDNTESLFEDTLSQADIFLRSDSVSEGEFGLRERLQQEMATLDGLILLQGVFEIGSLDGRLTLRKEFSGNLAVTFRVVVPEKKELDIPMEAGIVQLNVLGTVVGNTKTGQFIEVRPLAIF